MSKITIVSVFFILLFLCLLLFVDQMSKIMQITIKQSKQFFRFKNLVQIQISKHYSPLSIKSHMYMISHPVLKQCSMWKQKNIFWLLFTFWIFTNIYVCCLQNTAEFDYWTSWYGNVLMLNVSIDHPPLYFTMESCIFKSLFKTLRLLATLDFSQI